MDTSYTIPASIISDICLHISFLRTRWDPQISVRLSLINDYISWRFGYHNISPNVLHSFISDILKNSSEPEPFSTKELEKNLAAYCYICQAR